MTTNTSLPTILTAIDSALATALTLINLLPPCGDTTDCKADLEAIRELLSSSKQIGVTAPIPTPTTTQPTITTTQQPTTTPAPTTTTTTQFGGHNDGIVGWRELAKQAESMGLKVFGTRGMTMEFLTKWIADETARRATTQQPKLGEQAERVLALAAREPAIAAALGIAPPMLQKAVDAMIGQPVPVVETKPVLPVTPTTTTQPCGVAKIVADALARPTLTALRVACKEAGISGIDTNGTSKMTEELKAWQKKQGSSDVQVAKAANPPAIDPKPQQVTAPKPTVNPTPTTQQPKPAPTPTPKPPVTPNTKGLPTIPDDRRLGAQGTTNVYSLCLAYSEDGGKSIMGVTIPATHEARVEAKPALIKALIAKRIQVTGS